MIFIKAGTYSEPDVEPRRRLPSQTDLDHYLQQRNCEAVAYFSTSRLDGTLGHTKHAKPREVAQAPALAW